MKKGIGDTLLGWFIVQEGDEHEGDSAVDGDVNGVSAEDSVVRTKPTVRVSAPANASVQPSPTTGAARETPKGKPPLPSQVDDRRDAGRLAALPAIYERGGLDASEQERLARVLGLLEGLPREASAELQRAIVSASLEAFGVPIERVVHAANKATGALDTHAVTLRRRAEAERTAAESRIAALAQEIENMRRQMSEAERKEALEARCLSVERARIAGVIGFFEGSEAIATGARREG